MYIQRIAPIFIPVLNHPFFKELKRRNVYRVAITYAIVAWLIAQVMDLVAGAFSAPPWFLQIVLILLLVGFPLALILAWAYEVTPKGIVKTSELVETDPEFKSKGKPFTSNLVIGLLLALLIGQHLFLTSKNTQDNKALVQEESIAVLPFINLNGLEEVEYFSDGVTQEIIDELAKIKNLAVTAFTTTFPYKNKGRTNKEIAEELQVDYILSGSARIYGDSVRLSIELVNPFTNNRLWNQSYDEVLDNAHAVHAAIARQVANNLDVSLTDDEKRSLDNISTTNGHAFRLFLQAKSEINKLNKEGFVKSRTLLEEALQYDPDYAQAHTLLAWTILLGNGSWFPGMNHSTSESEEMALPHIEKAIELNPNTSDIYLVRGNLNVYYRGKIAAAKTDVDYALEINSWPRIPTNYCICTVVSTYLAAGDFEKAKELTNLAAEVDPGNLFIYHDKAMVAAIEGNWKATQNYYHQAIEALNAPFFNHFLGWSYYHDEQYEEAIEYLEFALTFGDYPIAMTAAYLSNAYNKIGDLEKSEYHRNNLLNRLNAGEFHVSLSLAMLEAGMNHRDEMFYWLERAYEEKDFGMAFFMNTDPVFNPYKSDPRFQEIRNQMLYGQTEPL